MTDPLHRQIAKITKTFLGANEDTHGVLTCDLTVDTGDGQAARIGGYCLGSKTTAFGMEFVKHLMDAAGAASWEEMVGKTIFVIREGDEWGRAIGIEHLPTEPGGRFIFAELADKYTDKS